MHPTPAQPECNGKNRYKQNRADFKPGEIILPDYAHLDTVIVINAPALNEAIEKCDGSDYEINAILHRYCAVLGQDMPEYGLDVDNDGYTITDYPSGAKIRNKWGANFDSTFRLNQ